MRALLAAALIVLNLTPELRSQTPVRPVDDGFPRYPVASVEEQYAGLCGSARVALDSSAATYVEMDSLRGADEPWSTCNDPAVMGMVKMVDATPTGTTADRWSEASPANQVVAPHPNGGVQLRSTSSREPWGLIVHS